MAVLSFRPFTTGLRLIDGSKLNRLFQGNEQMQSINVSGAATVNGAASLASTLAVTGTSVFTGLATFNGGESRSGAVKSTIVTVVATGATTGTARAISASAYIVIISASASTEGVKLPTAATGKLVWLFAPTGVGAKVYGSAAGQKVGALTTNTSAYSIPKNTGTMFVGQSSTQWLVSGHAS